MKLTVEQACIVSAYTGHMLVGAFTYGKFVRERLGFKKVYPPGTLAARTQRDEIQRAARPLFFDLQPED